MGDPLTIIWWLATVTGIAGVVVSLVRPAVRRTALLIGAAAFTVAGVLGILSIGIIFLAAAVACGILAAKQSPSNSESPATT